MVDVIFTNVDMAPFEQLHNITYLQLKAICAKNAVGSYLLCDFTFSSADKCYT